MDSNISFSEFVKKNWDDQLRCFAMQQASQSPRERRLW
jgi:hypothetical protein